MKRIIHQLRIIIALLLFSYYFPLSAQPFTLKTDSIISLTSDFNQLSSKTKILAENELKKRKEEFSEHQALLLQSNHFILIKNELEKALVFLKQGYASDEIYEEINELNGWRKIAGEGVITNKDEFQTVRNLTTTSILLKELLNRTNNRLQKILIYHKSLGQLQSKLDYLLMNSILYYVPNDSVALARYFQKLIMLSQELEPVTKPLKMALDSVQKIEIKVNTIKFSLESDIAETESQRKTLFEKIGIIESGTFGKGIKELSFKKVISFSLGKAWMVLVFYIFNHFSSLILMFLFIIGMAFYLIMLRRKNIDDKIPDSLKYDNYVLSNPFASATVMVITLFQFFLPLPPFVFTGLLWIICGIALSRIMRKAVIPIWYKTWLLFFVLLLVGFAGNLLLRQSVFERWTILVFSLSGMAAGIFFLIKLKKHEVKEKMILLFIGLMVVFEILALLNYLTGGYNQAKTFMTSGIFTVIVAFFIYWTGRLGKDTLQNSNHFHKGHEDEYHIKSIGKSEKKTPFYLYLLFFTGWFILISRNFYFYQTMFGPLHDGLIATRTIGEFTFTYQSVFIFFLVLFLSGIIARVVSFLASDTATGTVQSKPSGIGSWVLLIRIAVITIGVLLAFVSAGIPMDKFAIILGALSVGIGFGLQTLVNNLVSGLIIAFEKPINVGDIVEITGQTGKMKSIGIRSSVVTTWDGANVIIPNGDLLNQHLINWTMGSSRRRFDLLLSVAYGTDLEKTMQLLLDLMLTDPRILKLPKPFVLVKEFNNSSIDMVLKFWVPHFDIGLDVKSDLMLAIDVLFREHGIVIPFPQQDVHIRPQEDPSKEESS
jgi:potassium-dependent mechanosensitive channel